MGLFNFKKEKSSEEIPPINKLVDENKQEVQNSYSLPTNEDEVAHTDTSDKKKEDIFNLDDFEVEDVGNQVSTEVKEQNDLDSLDIDENQDKEVLNIEEEKNPEFDQERNYKFSRTSSIHEKEFFITTSQFKKLLEIIDNIKLKVKQSNDLYLKLTDIKSEEDIEFENLRKTYAYVEEKLYELDKTIFEE